jgi:hypothetical protein
MSVGTQERGMTRPQTLTSILAASVLLAVLSCSGDPGRLSNAPDWAECRIESDCTEVPGAVACQDGFCVDTLGKRIAAPSSEPQGGVGGKGNAGAGGASGSSGQPAGGTSAGAGGRGPAG